MVNDVAEQSWGAILVTMGGVTLKDHELTVICDPQLAFSVACVVPGTHDD